MPSTTQPSLITMTQTTYRKSFNVVNRSPSGFLPRRHFSSTITDFSQQIYEIFNVTEDQADRCSRVDSTSAYYAGSLLIESRHPTAATYVACRERARLPCWPSRGQQVSHQRWISGIHCAQVRKHASEGSTLSLKPGGDVTTEVQNKGYQWPHKKDLCPPKIKIKIKIFTSFTLLYRKRYSPYGVFTLPTNETEKKTDSGTD